MAATRLIALHVNKGKTVARCLADRTDYSQNAAKIDGGKYISAYECDPETADQRAVKERWTLHLSDAFRLRNGYAFGRSRFFHRCHTLFNNSP